MVVAVLVGCVAIIVAGGVLYVRHVNHRLNRQLSDATLCYHAATALGLIPGNDLQLFSMSTSHTTASRAAADMARAHGVPHPWDQEARNTPVIRCQSGKETWLVDAKGHATALPHQ